MLNTRALLFRALVGLAALLAMTNVGCGGSPYMQAPPPPPPLSVSKLLAAATNNTIAVYALPITAASTPVATIPDAFVSGIAFDSAGQMLVDVGGQIQVFDQPISNGAAPAFVISAPSGSGLLFAGGLAFNAAGALFVGGGLVPNGCHEFCTHTASVSVLDGPISSSSVVKFTFVESNGCCFSLVSYEAFDKRGDLWAVVGEAILDETAPPFSGNSQTQIALAPPYTIPLGVAFDSAGNMYVSTGRAPGSGVQGDIVAYQPPFTASSQPTLLFGTTTFDYGNGLALDSSGNMYAGTSSGLFMFSPPFTATGTPVVTLPGSFGIVAVGP